MRSWVIVGPRFGGLQDPARPRRQEAHQRCHQQPRELPSVDVPGRNSGRSINEDGSGVQEMVVMGDGNMTISGAWSQLSDVNVREGLEASDSTEVLVQVGAPSAPGRAWVEGQTARLAVRVVRPA